MISRKAACGALFGCVTLGSVLRVDPADAVSVSFDQVYSATDCKFYSKQANDTALVYSGATRVTNSSASDVKVACPIMRRKPAFSIVSFGDMHMDKGPGWSISDCNLFVSAYDGASFMALPSPSISVVGQSQQYYWDAYSPGSNYYYGNMSYVCFMPPGGTIYTYEFAED